MHSTTQQIRRNQSVAITLGAGDSDTCPYCGRLGLRILPLRYAVVPDFLPEQGLVPPGEFPGLRLGRRSGASSDKDLVKPLSAHRLVLRTLRTGYLMVYFGEEQWHAYQVDQEGRLKRLAPGYVPDDLILPSEDAAGNAVVESVPEHCKRQGDHVAASYLCIGDDVTLGGKKVFPARFWVAFSAVPWSRSVRARYEHGEEAAQRRARRMQEFSTAQLTSDADAVDDAFAWAEPDTGAERLNSLVLELAKDKAQAHARFHYSGSDPTALKWTEGDAAQLKEVPAEGRWHGEHGVHMRTGELRALAECSGMAIVLHDRIGITQEANSTRMNHRQFDLAFQGHKNVHRATVISNAIVGLREGLRRSIGDAWHFEECRSGIPDVIQYMDEHTVRSSTRAQRADREFQTIWPPMLAHFDEAKRKRFEEHRRDVLKRSGTYHAASALDYSLWLKDHRWQEMVEDFDRASAAQDALLQQEWARVLHGGPTEARVAEIWRDYFTKDAADPQNPIYRALFGNHQNVHQYLFPEIDAEWNVGAPQRLPKLYFICRALINNPVESSGWAELRANGLSASLFEKGPKSRVTNPLRNEKAGLLRAYDGLMRITARYVQMTANAFASALAVHDGAGPIPEGKGLEPALRMRAFKALQAAAMLYDRIEMFIVRVRSSEAAFARYLRKIGAGSTATGFPSAHAARGAVDPSDLPGTDAPPGQRPPMDITVVLSESHENVMQTLSEKAGSTLDDLFEIDPHTLSPHAEQWVRRTMAKGDLLERAVRDRVRQLKDSDAYRAARDARRVSRAGTGIYGVLQFLFGVWALKATVERANSTFVSDPEARLMVVSAAFATAGGLLETVSASAHVLRQVSWAMPATKLAVNLVVVAVVIEALVNAMASERLAAQGDSDAADWYWATSLLLVASMSLIGPAVLVNAGLVQSGAWLGLGAMGWGLVIIGAAIVAGMVAQSKVDTPLEIWLERCYFGIPKRHRKVPHEQNRPWRDDELDEELNQLNSLLWGMTAELVFDPLPPPTSGYAIPMAAPPPRDYAADMAWLTHVPFKLRIKLPGWVQNSSEVGWRLEAVRDGRRVSIAGTRTARYLAAKDAARNLPPRADPGMLLSLQGPRERIIRGPKLDDDGTHPECVPASGRRDPGQLLIVELDGVLDRGLGDPARPGRGRPKYQLKLFLDYVPRRDEPEQRAVIRLTVDE